MISIYGTENGTYIVTMNDDPAQTLVLSLPEVLQVWSRLDRFVRDQATDGKIAAGHPLAGAVDYVDFAEALTMVEEAGVDISDRGLRYAFERAHIVGAYKDGGRWKAPRSQVLAWIGERSGDKMTR